MRIAILTSGILPVPAVQGGAVENLIDFCLEYNDRHRLHDITVYSIWHPDVEQHPALNSKVNHYIYIKVNSLWGRLKKYIYKQTHKEGYYHYTIEYFLDEVIRLIKHRQYDIILLENRPGYTLRIQDLTTSKIVIHQENDFLNDQSKEGMTIYDKAALIINTSDYITRRVKTIDKNSYKCKTVLNGIDTDCFYTAISQKRDFMGFHDTDFVIVYSGRLNKEKGILELLQAIKKINRADIKLLIIGGSFYGKDKQPTEFIHLLKQESEAVKDKVLFTGYLNYEQIPSYLKMADIAVVPSMWDEPFGLTVVEALAAGLPLITTRSGGIPEICDGVATIVDREDIVNNLAKAILDLYKDPKKRQAMSKAGLERSKLFSKERYAREFFEALTHIERTSV